MPATRVRGGRIGGHGVRYGAAGIIPAQGKAMYGTPQKYGDGAGRRGLPNTPEDWITYFSEWDDEQLQYMLTRLQSGNIPARASIRFGGNMLAAVQAEIARRGVAIGGTQQLGGYYGGLVQQRY